MINFNRTWLVDASNKDALSAAEKLAKAKPGSIVKFTLEEMNAYRVGDIQPIPGEWFEANIDPVPPTL